MEPTTDQPAATQPVSAPQPDELQTARDLMDAKLERKRELLGVLKGLNTSLDALHLELDALRPQMQGAGKNSSGGRLREKAEKIEFQIATSAHTPAQEREMLKGLKVVQLELDRLKKDTKVFTQADTLREKIRAASQTRAEARHELDALRAELESLYQIIVKLGAERARAAGERRERVERGNQERGERARRGEEWKARNSERKKQNDEERADMAPYLKDSHDPYVSLEEIVEIKKKPANSS